MTLRLTHLARAAFWIAAVVAFVFAVLPHPPQLPGQPSDKVQAILKRKGITKPLPGEPLDLPEAEVVPPPAEDAAPAPPAEG